MIITWHQCYLASTIVATNTILILVPHKYIIYFLCLTPGLTIKHKTVNSKAFTFKIQV